jgi:hypothetical protein
MLAAAVLILPAGMTEIKTALEGKRRPLLLY